MSIYFGFSDECGSYLKVKNSKYLRVHPYYIRCTLLMNANEWKNFRIRFNELKLHYSLPIEKEIKWAHLWNLQNYQSRVQTIPNEKDFKFLESYDYHDLIDFVENSLSLINQLEYKKIIVTFTENSTCPLINEKAILKMHLQEHMQRIEMEIQSRIENNLAVLFFDPVSEHTDKLFRDIYFELYNSGDFISQYKHIKDSLNIENSHQSVGVQLADYVSGAFSSVLKSINSTNYERGKKMFLESIYPNLRTYNGTVWGIGIREVPSNMAVRKYFAREITAIVNGTTT